MLNPKTCTIKQMTEFAQNLKDEMGDVDDDSCVYIHEPTQAALIEFLSLAHPNGHRIDPSTAMITIARKPENCDRPGASQTCYYIKADSGAVYRPVWFSDCRAGHRSQRLQPQSLAA
jgi:hypothetical protein